MKSRNFCLIIIVVFTFISRTYAQVPSWQWAGEVVQWSSSSDVTGWAIASDQNSNVYVTGAVNGDTIDIAGSIFYNPGFAIYVIKYDSSGVMQWARVDGGDGLATPGGLAVDADGNVVVSGAFLGDSVVFGGTTLYNAAATYQDILVVKYDTNGNLLWVISAGGSDNEWVEAVAIDPQNNIFVTGSFSGDSLNLGSFTLINSGIGSEDIYLAKLDPNGIVLWAKSAGGGNYEWPTSVTTDAFGNAIICGPYFSDICSFDSVDLVSPYGDNHDQLFVAQYSSGGNINWAKQVVLTEQAFDSYFYDVATDAYGNIFASGSCISDTIFVDGLQLVAAPFSNRDMLLVKYNPDGLLEWARREVGNGDIHAFDVAVNESGEAYVTGYFQCDSIVFGTDTTLAIDPWFYSDMFLVKYLPSGSVEWALNVGGTYIPGSWGYRQMGVATDLSGHVFVSGTFSNDSVLFGSNQLMLNNCFPNVYVAMLNDGDECSAAFTLVADTAQLHHYWLLNQATGAAPLEYLWNWGDGSTDTIAFPSHVYAVDGYYTICLTITDALNCTHTECHTNYLQRNSNELESTTMVYVDVVAAIPTGISPEVSPAITILPNPASEQFTIQSKAPFDRVELFDALGNTLIEQVVPGNTLLKTISLNGITQGVYFLRVSTDKLQTVRKLIINKQ